MTPEMIIDILVKVIYALSGVVAILVSGFVGHHLVWVRKGIDEAKQATRDAENRINNRIEGMESRAAKAQPNVEQLQKRIDNNG